VTLEKLRANIQVFYWLIVLTVAGLAATLIGWLWARAKVKKTT
jgi:hypothetical protein